MRLNAITKTYLLVLACYHTTNGLLTFCFPSIAYVFNEILYDFHFKIDDQLFLVSKPWGALSIFVGVTVFFAFRDPRRYRGVVYGLIVLLLTRAAYRYIYAEKMREVIKTELYRNYISIAILLAGTLLLIAWSINDLKRKNGFKDSVR